MLSFILLGSVFSFFQPAKTSALTNFFMTVQPRKVATRATYRFNVTIEKRLKVHEAITLVWPPGTIIDPPIPEDEKKRKERLTQIIESMSIGLSPCSACQGLPVIEDTPEGGISLRFNTHIELNPEIEGYSDIVVTVPDTCGFVTPPKPGTYQWKFSTGAEPTFVSSEPFEIVESAIGVPEGMPVVEVKPSSFRANASYTITFNVGKGGWLREGDGRIRVKFPEGTQFADEEIKEKFLLVNGKPITSSPLAVRNQLTFITPIEIPDSGRIEIFIDEGAGIINPPKPGEYVLEVSTIPADKDWVASAPYLIEKGGALLKVVPAKVNKPARYSFSFILEAGKTIDVGSKIHVKFPEGTILPSSLDKSKILIGGKPTGEISVNGLEVVISAGVKIESESAVDILFETGAGIINTTEPGEIKLGYKLETDPEFLMTSPVELIESRLEILDVTNEPKNAFSVTSWTIKGLTGDNGALKKGDHIAVAFPDNTDMPQESDPNTVTINDVPAEKITIEGVTAHFYVAQDIKGGTEFTLQTTLDSGFRNPTQEKVGYVLKVTSNVEDFVATSPTFFTTPKLPVSSYEIKGGTKGENGWYLEPPVVSFSCDDPSAVIKLYWDDKDNQIITFDGSPKPLDIGQYESRITYWAESITGVEPPKTFIVKVDTVLPEVVMEKPTEVKTITTEPTIEVVGRTTLIKTIRFGVDSLEYDLIAFINNEKVVVDPETGYFSTTIDLKQGVNVIDIVAKDEAGHEKILQYEVVYDTEPPQIDITYPLEDKVVTKRKFSVTGTTDPTAQLTINGEFVYLEQDGSFSYEVTARKIGKMTFELLATDPVGNVTEKTLHIMFGYVIELVIGKTTSIRNGEAFTPLTMAPIIQNGRTLVPFGFIGREALEAEVGYTQHPTTKLVDTVWLELDGTKVELKIGSNIAKVNGKDVKMDVACQIISGNTMVPLRFVSESLGADIGWDNATQKITITYPKL